MSDYVVCLNDNGSVRSAGAVEEVELSDDESEEELEEIKEGKGKSDEVAETVKPEEEKKANKLVKAEEKAEGRISRQAMFSFFR